MNPGDVAVFFCADGDCYGAALDLLGLPVDGNRRRRPRSCAHLISTLPRRKYLRKNKHRGTAVALCCNIGTRFLGLC